MRPPTIVHELKMIMSGHTIIEANTQVTERPDVWPIRAPANVRDLVPRVETRAKRTQRGCLTQTVQVHVLGMLAGGPEILEIH